jgi:hypothetical protein
MDSDIVHPVLLEFNGWISRILKAQEDQERAVPEHGGQQSRHIHSKPLEAGLHPGDDAGGRKAAPLNAAYAALIDIPAMWMHGDSLLLEDCRSLNVGVVAYHPATAGLRVCSRACCLLEYCAQARQEQEQAKHGVS